MNQSTDQSSHIDSYSPGRNYNTSSTTTSENIERERGPESGIVGSFQAWLRDHAIKDIVIPVLRFLVFGSVFTIVSSGLYTVMYLYLMPKALVREPMYFDYSVTPPTGRLNLQSAHKQWEYMSGGVSAGDRRSDNPKDSRRFLRSDFEYTVDISFELSKSSRNFDIGKFMAHLSLFDNLGDLVAKSSRPVVMPYQSTVSLTLDSIVKYPLRLLGFCGINEVTTVHVPMMTEYREPVAGFTDSIEITLSSSKADIGTVEVTIMPVLRGLVYFMWYFPTSTAFFCVFAMIGVQLSFYMVYVAASFLVSYLTTDEGEGENVVGSRTYTSVASTSSLDRVVDEDNSKEEAEEGEQVGSSSPFTDYTTRQSNALSRRSYSSGYSESNDSYNIVDDTSSAADAETSAGNQMEAVLIDEASGAAGDNSSLRRRK